jgi:hypothetical protein
MQAASVADEVLIQLGENVQMYIGTRAKPNINAKYVYHPQLSMSTCTYTKEPLSVFKPLDLHGRYPQQGRRWGSP